MPEINAAKDRFTGDEGESRMMKKNRGKSNILTVIVIMIMMMLLSGCGKGMSVSSVLDNILFGIASAFQTEQEAEPEESPLEIEEDSPLVLEEDDGVVIGDPDAEIVFD